MKVPVEVVGSGPRAVEDHLIKQLNGFAWVPLVDTMQGGGGSVPRLNKMLVAVKGSVSGLKFADASTISAQEPIGLNSALQGNGHDIRFFGNYDYFLDQMRGMFAIAHDAADVEFVSEGSTPYPSAILLPERHLLGFSPQSSLAVELKAAAGDDDTFIHGIGFGVAGAALARYIIKGKV